MNWSLKDCCLAAALVGWGAFPPCVRGQTLSFLRGLSGTVPFEFTNGLASDGTYFYSAGSRTPVPPSFNTDPEAFLRKIDANGNTVWLRQFVQQSEILDVAYFAGGVYITGSIDPSAARNRVAFVGRYDPDGNSVWIRQFGTADRSSYGQSVAVSESGIYVLSVTSLNSRGSSWLPTLLKYDFNGTVLWSHDISAASFPLPSLAADTSGLYMAIRLPSETILRKYAHSGAELWTSRIESANYVGSLAVHGSGLYAVGSNGNRFFTWKYDPNGAQIWEREGSFGNKLAVDDTGVYVAGAATGTLPGQCTAGSSDVALRKYDLAGAESWTRQFGTLRDDFPRGIAVHPAGVYVGVSSGREWDGSITYGSFLAKMEKTPAPVVQGKPRILGECVLNAASHQGGGVAPGEIVTIRGSSIGPFRLSSASLTQGRLSTALAETRVLFNGVAAPLLYVSEDQISAIVPYGVAGRSSADVVVEYQGERSDAITLPVLESRPGIFTTPGNGYLGAAALNQDGTVNSFSNPAPRGSILTFFATGEGLTDPGGEDGVIAGASPPKPKLPLEVAFGSKFENELFGNKYFPAQIVYAGGVPGAAAGLLQINVRVPENLPADKPGLWQLNLAIGSEEVSDGFLHESNVFVVVR